MATSSYVIASMHSIQFYLVTPFLLYVQFLNFSFKLLSIYDLSIYYIQIYNYLFFNGSNLDMYGVFNQKIISRNILPNIFVNNGE